MERRPLFGIVGGVFGFSEVLCVVKLTEMGVILDRFQRTSGAKKGTEGGIPERRQILCEAARSNRTSWEGAGKLVYMFFRMNRHCNENDGRPLTFLSRLTD